MTMSRLSHQHCLILILVLIEFAVQVMSYSQPMTRTAALRVFAGAASAASAANGAIAAPPCSAIASRSAATLHDAQGGILDALLFDTASRSFLSADPQRHLAVALAARRRAGAPRVFF